MDLARSGLVLQLHSPKELWWKGRAGEAWGQAPSGNANLCPIQTETEAYCAPSALFCTVCFFFHSRVESRWLMTATLIPNQASLQTLPGPPFANLIPRSEQATLWAFRSHQP